MRSAGKRKNGAIGLSPEATLTAAMPISISALASSVVILVRSLCDQVCEPTVMAGRDVLFQDLGMPAGVLADREEHGLGALVGQRLEHALGVAGPGAVVEGQHDLVVAQEVIGLEVLEAEAGRAGGVDFHHALDAEGFRIVAFLFGQCRERGRGLLGHRRGRSSGLGWSRSSRSGGLRIFGPRGRGRRRHRDG